MSSKSLYHRLYEHVQSQSCTMYIYTIFVCILAYSIDINVWPMIYWLAEDRPGRVANAPAGATSQGTPISACPGSLGCGGAEHDCSGPAAS